MFQLISFVLIFFSLSFIQANDEKEEKSKLIESAKTLDLAFSEAKNSDLVYKASKNGNLEALKDLDTKGVDIFVNFYNKNALHLASYFDHPKLINWLILKGFDVNGKIKNKDITYFESPLILNIMVSASFESFKLLIDHGADISAIDQWGMQPLHWAAFNGDIQKIDYLIEKGADLHSNQSLEGSPVHVAAYNNQLETVKHLARLGANLELKNLSGRNIFSIILNSPLASVQEKDQFKAYMEDYIQNKTKLNKILEHTRRTSGLPNYVRSRYGR